MKITASLLFLVFSTLPALSGNWFGFGPGPWNNGEPYAGYLNGRYMGVVTGNNISGVLGFALVDGAPPFRQDQQQQQQQQQQGQGGQFQERQPAQIRPDVLQNYFAIFVEGRVYSGITFAGIDIDSNTVAGALQGENPAAFHNFTAQSPIPQQTVTVTRGDATTPPIITTNSPPLINMSLDALPIINRGLSGGFTANINSKKATFTYSGTGQLSTPANRQTVTMSGFGQTNNPLVPPFLIPPTLLTNEVITANVQTETTPFNIRGIRTSFVSSNPALVQDQQQQQQ
jgi:hypothetical protein